MRSCVLVVRSRLSTDIDRIFAQCHAVHELSEIAEVGSSDTCSVGVEFLRREHIGITCYNDDLILAFDLSRCNRCYSVLFFHLSGFRIQD